MNSDHSPRQIWHSPTPCHLPWCDALRAPFRSGVSDCVGENSRFLQQLGGEAPPPAARPPSPHLGFAGVQLVLSPEAKRGRSHLEESWQSPVNHPAFVTSSKVLHSHKYSSKCRQRLLLQRRELSEGLRVQGLSRVRDCPAPHPSGSPSLLISSVP